MSSCVFIASYDNDPRGPFSREDEPLHAGPRAWRWLHLKALDKGLTRQLLADFTRCIGCPDCRRHFLQIQHDHPLEETNQFAWTVRAHNKVNASRGVGQMTLEEAEKLWTGERRGMTKSQRPEIHFSDAIAAL